MMLQQRNLLFLVIVLFVSLSRITNAQQCGGVLTQQRGRVYLPGYRRANYPPNLNCVWTFRARQIDSIQVIIRDIQIENGANCPNDYLEFSSFASKPQKLCGVRKPPRPLMGWGPANLTFVSNEQNGGRGFLVEYGMRFNARRTPPNPCESNPCQNNGKCQPDRVINYECLCPSNFAGRHCEEPVKDLCEPNPCKNGGVCSDSDGEFQCSCSDGWQGNTCEIDFDECESDPCLNGATCINEPNKYICECAEGFKGANCEINTDECISSPCQNGGTCADDVNSFQCTCVDGYTGEMCETDIDECASSPCQNGATCENEVNKFTCQCEEDWEGDLCEIEIIKEVKVVDPCESEPCKNDASCEADSEGGYKCTCKKGWEGENCEDKITMCDSTTCKNGATCVEKFPEDFECNCVSGYNGKTCSEDINECSSSPCVNGGTCLDEINKYKCECLEDFEGSNCQIKIIKETPAPPKPPVKEEKPKKVEESKPKVVEVNVKQEPPKPEKKPEENIEKEEGDPNDPCLPSPCMNEADCIDMGDLEFVCMCKRGFSGELCETGSNVCIPNPCKNGGSCTEWGEKFICACAPGFIGEECTEDINECKSNPCKDGLECVDDVNEYICREPCDPGYTGKECEIEINECDSNPCLNGATCEDKVGSFVCSCSEGYKGITCSEKREEDEPSPCESQPCKNDAVCETKEGTPPYNCLCKIGWKGKLCEDKVLKGCKSPREGSKHLVPFGATLRIDCDPGYDMIGKGEITCLKNGSFNGDVPKCVGNGTSTKTKISKRKMSPFIISMIACGTTIVLAIIGLFSYLTIFSTPVSPNAKTKLLKPKTTKVSKVDINGLDDATTATGSKNTIKDKDLNKKKKSKKSSGKIK